MSIVKNVKMIDVSDWDKLVEDTYKRPYSFQQQEGCQSRGIVKITIPSEYTYDEEMHDSIPEKVNGDKMGIKFEKWLKRDPKKPLLESGEDWMLRLFWERNFYPELHTIANDIYKKGLIETGKYIINIDW